MAKWVAIFAFLAAALCFAWSGSRLDRLMAQSLSLPLPPVGHTVSGAVAIAEPATFELQATVPTTGRVDTRPGYEPILPVRLEATLERPGTPAVTLSSRLRYSGSIGTDLQLYSSAPVTLRSGAYTVRITTLSLGPGPSSAVLSLEPVQEQASLLVLLSLARFVGWFMLAIGGLCVVARAWPNKSFKPNPLRGSA